MKLLKCCIFISILLFGKPAVSQHNSDSNIRYPVIPIPTEITEVEGFFEIKSNTKIVLDDSLKFFDFILAEFADRIQKATGYWIPVISLSEADSSGNTIWFHKNDGMDLLGEEGYRLNISQKDIKVFAESGAGVYYAIQTLYQLLPIEIEFAKSVDNVEWKVPCAYIRDVPRFKWRGVLLDVGRHFFPVSFIKKYIDMIASYKMNVFHWHLTDDQGWRIEIKQYPKLTEVGAWRSQTNGNGIPHSGFYTQEEIIEIVQHASSRFVTIVPEIEMPGHCGAALASYPELSCTGGPFDVSTKWGVHNEIFCAGKEETFRFLTNVLSEVFELFPGEFIHIGGDEVPKQRWIEHQLDQDRMYEEGLNDEDELQSYFIKRIENYLKTNGRRLIGWDEILQGGLAPNAVVMSWRGMEGGILAANAGHDVVMTPKTHCYFSRYQATSGEPKAWGRYLPLEKVYSFEPVPENINKSKKKHVLGAHACLWTEYIATTDYAEYMLFPRLCALSEVVWSPIEKKNISDFYLRLLTHYHRLSAKQINYRHTNLPKNLVDRNGWIIHYVDSEEKILDDNAAVNAIDGNWNTIWHTEWYGSFLPHEIQIDMGKEYKINGFQYIPRQEGSYHGTIKEYEFYVSNDGEKWGGAVASGEFEKSRSVKEVKFITCLSRFIRLVALSEVDNKRHTSMAELNVFFDETTGLREKFVSKVNHFKLYQNYPNPFNPVTIIRYQLSAFSEVDLNVYNLLGQKVAVLVSDKQLAGFYEYSWNAISFSSGFYFYKLKIGREEQTRKMMLLR
jgi:hexosaminidase